MLCTPCSVLDNLQLTTHSDKDADQVTTLRNRVAELEGVVRELKNKPQPRWAANALATASAAAASASAALASATGASNAPPPPISASASAPTPRGGGGGGGEEEPSTPAALNFPKESWHVRSARKDRQQTASSSVNNNSLNNNNNNVPAPAPAPNVLSSLGRAEERDREAERNATHAVHNTLNAYLDRENSVDFRCVFLLSSLFFSPPRPRS